MHEKVVLIGAGSASFTRGLIADIIRRHWTGELALVDVDSDALEVARGLAAKMLQAAEADVKLSASTDRAEVLRDATVVICTVGVGGRRTWERDVYIPRRYGIFQPVGDTVMPGGTSRALRMIPAMVEIARDVQQFCPSALFFNYGNPMSPVCRAVRKATGAPMVGLCHGVFHVAKHLASVLGVDADTLRYTAVGINHLTWFTELRSSGVDLLPRLAALARERVAALRAAAEAEGGDVVENPFTWELTDLFGAFPAVLDRHVVEFFPALFGAEDAYYGQTLGVDAFSFEEVIEAGDRRFARMRDLALSAGPLAPSELAASGGEHEQVTDIVESIRHDRGTVFSANVPNIGQVANLPVDAIIECPCIADASGVRAVMLPPMSPGLCGTLATRFQWVETVVEAALRRSRKQVVQALILDGSAAGVSTAGALADDLLAAHAEWLGEFR